MLEQGQGQTITYKDVEQAHGIPALIDETLKTTAAAQAKAGKGKARKKEAPSIAVQFQVHQRTMKANHEVSAYGYYEESGGTGNDPAIIIAVAGKPDQVLFCCEIEVEGATRLVQDPKTKSTNGASVWVETSGRVRYRAVPGGPWLDFDASTKLISLKDYERKHLDKYPGCF